MVITVWFCEVKLRYILIKTLHRLQLIIYKNYKPILINYFRSIEINSFTFSFWFELGRAFLKKIICYHIKIAHNTKHVTFDLVYTKWETLKNLTFCFTTTLDSIFGVLMLWPYSNKTNRICWISHFEKMKKKKFKWDLMILFISFKITWLQHYEYVTFTSKQNKQIFQISHVMVHAHYKFCTFCHKWGNLE